MECAFYRSHVTLCQRGPVHNASSSHTVPTGVPQPVTASGLHDDVAVLDMYRKCLGDVGTFLQLLAAFDRDRIGAHPEPLRIEPGLAVAHVEFPAVPGAAQQFADAITVI